MKELEDRIKERLEGYESSLPEGDLAEFKALLDASYPSSPKRRAAWIAWLTPVLVAAGTSLFFVFHNAPQQNIIQVIDRDSTIAGAVEVQELEPMETHAAIQTLPSSVRLARLTEEPSMIQEKPDKSEESGESGETKESVESEESMNPEESNEPESVENIQEEENPVRVKVRKGKAGVIGGTGGVALTSGLVAFLTNISSDAADPPLYDAGIPETGTDRRTDNDKHHMPLRTGFSVRVPLSNRWSVTTGLDYSWYSSELGYSRSGIHKQNAHYIGIPARADFTIVRNRWLDIYAGAGVAADFCVSASEAGSKIDRDGVGFSLNGACGFQFNITKNLGFYLDPTLSWNIPSGNRVLETYKSEHPFMFTVSAGFRFTVPSARMTSLPRKRQ